MPTNSACSTNRSISTSRNSIKIDQSLPIIPTQNQSRDIMPALKKAHTQFNFKDTKVYTRFQRPAETKKIDKLPNSQQTQNIESQSKIDISSSQKNFSIPSINQQLLRKENTTFLHFVTNPFSFAEKPRQDKKLINYPSLIQTKKYVRIEPTKVEQKLIMPEVEIGKLTRKIDEVVDVKGKKGKKKAKKNTKRKNKKKNAFRGNDSEDSLSENDDVENIGPTTNENTRPQGAQLANRRLREKIRFENSRIEENSELDEPIEVLKNLEQEMEQIEKKVQHEQEELSNLSNFEYTKNFKQLNLNIKQRQKKPFVKPNFSNKNEVKVKVIAQSVYSDEEEKSQKKFHLKPLQRPYRIAENEKLLGKNTGEFILEDDWLLKWCILENHRNVKCEAAFVKYDTEKRGFLTGEDLIQAIESIVKLNNLKMTYLFSVLNLVNIDALIFGADIKLFTIIVSLANRINHLDDNWFSNLLPQYDLFTIENKVFKVKNLWNYLVDQETKLICIKDVLIEFEAGGVTSKHVEYAKEKFSHKIYFDIVDYLTYIPLFVHIHDKIIRNPLIIKQDI